MRLLDIQWAYRFFPQRPNPHHKHRISGMYWVGEANLIISSERLKELGGFDDRYREHDIKPLAYFASKKRYVNYYEPRLVVKHNAVNVRPSGRQLRIWMTDIQMSRQYGGLRNWFFPLFFRRK